MDKPRFFKNIIASVIDFDKYKEFVFDNVSTTLKYFFKLMLIFVILISIAMTYKTYLTLSKAANLLKQNLPELTYTNNILNVNSDMPIITEFDEINGIIIVNTNNIDQAVTNEHLEKIKLYNAGILLLKDKAIIKTNATTTLASIPYQEFASKYKIGDFSKQDLLNIINNTDKYEYIIAFCAVTFLMIFIYLFIIYVLVTLIDGIVLTALAFIISRISRMKIKFSALFSLSVHALTLPVILNLFYIIINALTGFTIKYFNWMYTTISYVYIITAIFIIKSDFIKQQMQLTKIIEEQEKIKAEEKTTEEQEKEQEDEKEDKKKEKNENKDEKKLGEEPV